MRVTWREIAIILIGALVIGSIVFSIKAEDPRFLAHPKDQPKESLGKIISADVLTTASSSMTKIIIKTEKTTIVITGVTRVDIGKEAYSEEWSNNKRFVGWEGSKDIYLY